MKKEQVELSNFEIYFPSLAEKMVDYRPSYTGSIIVDLDDGTSVLYDDLAHTIRSIPRDCNSMTEAEFMNEFGKRLQHIMDFKNMSQKELSARTGIASSLLSRYMNGKICPSFWVVNKISKAIGCSTDDFRYLD